MDRGQVLRGLEIAAPAPDLSSVVRRIGSLFERAYADGAERPAWAEVEEVLTEGYALALALEGRRSQIERRISRLVADPPGRDAGHELRGLSARHGELDRNVLWLRSLLAELHEYGSVLRDEASNGPRSDAAGDAEGRPSE